MQWRRICAGYAELKPLHPIFNRKVYNFVKNTKFFARTLVRACAITLCKKLKRCFTHLPKIFRLCLNFKWAMYSLQVDKNQELSDDAEECMFARWIKRNATFGAFLSYKQQAYKIYNSSMVELLWCRIEQAEA